MFSLRSHAVALLLLPALAAGQVPERLGYQGRLLDAQGRPAMGAVDVTFRIFDAESGGTALWIDLQKLSTTDGYYSTSLDGSSTRTPPNPFPPNLFDGSPRYLSLTIGDQELLPRQAITSVAYALRAKSLSGGTVNASSVSVGGRQVIDSMGRWVGPGSGGSLRASYDLEEGAQTRSADSSGYGNDLTLSTSGVSWTTAGHTGNALNFDGASGFASALDQPALSPAQEITVSAWVFQTAGANWTGCIVNKPGQYALAIVNGHVQFAVQTVKGPAAAMLGSGALPSTTAPAWAHVMASYDGETIRTFVNGFLTDHADYPNGLIASSASALRIGACVDKGGAETGFFAGRIDEVRIWGHAKGTGAFRNVARWQGYANDDTDNGALSGRTVTYSKKAPGTGLRVLWSDNFREYNSNTACRWEVVFNGASCTSPGGVFFDKYEGGSTSSNRLDMATVMGTCYGLPPGPVAVSTRVGPTPGYSGQDCYTGWNKQLVSLEVEEVP